eukprot:UN09245
MNFDNNERSQEFINWWDGGKRSPAQNKRQQIDAQNKDLDRVFLKEFYHCLGGPNWIKNRNWLSEKPLSEWEGITVQHGILTQIRLRGNKLKGRFPKP